MLGKVCDFRHVCDISRMNSSQFYWILTSTLISLCDHSEKEIRYRLLSSFLSVGVIHRIELLLACISLRPCRLRYVLGWSVNICFAILSGSCCGEESTEIYDMLVLFELCSVFWHLLYTSCRPILLCEMSCIFWCFLTLAQRVRIMSHGVQLAWHFRCAE